MAPLIERAAEERKRKPTVRLPTFERRTLTGKNFPPQNQWQIGLPMNES